MNEKDQNQWFWHVSLVLSSCVSYFKGGATSRQESTMSTHWLSERLDTSSSSPASSSRSKLGTLVGVFRRPERSGETIGRSDAASLNKSRPLLGFLGIGGGMDKKLEVLGKRLLHAVSTMTETTVEACSTMLLRRRWTSRSILTLALLVPAPERGGYE